MSYHRDDALTNVEQIKSETARIDAETAQINAETAQLRADIRRRRQRADRVHSWLTANLSWITLATLVPAGVLWLIGFERWFATYPLTLMMGTFTVLLSGLAWLQEGKRGAKIEGDLWIGSGSILLAIAFAGQSGQ